MRIFFNNKFASFAYHSRIRIIFMYKSIFQKAGLTPTQASILEYLYDKKEDKASAIAQSIKKSRAIVYKDLEELANLNIIEKVDKPNKASFFRIGHPTQMEKFFDKKENEIKKDRQLFANYLPDMVSSYNLIHSKPGVKYYEGIEGMKIVSKDSLTAQGIIYTYLDTESLMKNIQEFSSLYTKERLAKKIVKKIIATDNAYSRDYMTKNNEVDFNPGDLTQIKLLDGQICSFNTIMQIYNNKISYINYTNDNIISVIIEDLNIFNLQKNIFEYNWEKAKTLKQLVDIENQTRPA
jgi:HTH-type transcriptional regulator, sugar sensing transcriptional regulator